MQIKIIRTQKVLSPTQIPLGDYVINPYRGCEFGCLYCYSQENKNTPKTAFFSSLGVKINAPQVLEKELQYKRPKRVLLGSTTECFQFQEQKFGLTHQILAILNNHQIPYTILTKSHLITDYLSMTSENKYNKIYFTFNMSSDRTLRYFEKKSPSLKKRLQAITQIMQRNIRLRIHIGPFIPYMCSLEKILEMLPEQTAEIDVELYHPKQGRFNEVLQAIEFGWGKERRQKVEDIYKNEENYAWFSQELREEMALYQKSYPATFYYIVPSWGEFYTSDVSYEKPLRTL